MRYGYYLVVLLCFSRCSFIVNTATSYFIKLHGKYVLFSTIMLVIGVIEHQGWYSPKGGGFCNSLAENSM